MLFTLFIISLLGTFAFTRVRVFGKVTIFGNRRCSDDLIDILGMREKYDNTAQLEEEESWLDGEVPWIFYKKNDTNNSTVSFKVEPKPFDPLEPCSIGHLLF
jgi:hypothetical protein